MGHFDAGSCRLDRPCGLRAIEKEIAQVSPFTHPHSSSSQAYLGELRQRRNSLLPVNRLPVEILCQILLDVREWSEGQEWVPITQVCSRWRTVCIGLGALWTDISDAHTLEWMDLALQRSGQSLIFIDLCQYDSGKMDLALTALSRCHTMLVGGVRDLSSTHFARLLAPAPCLEELHLHYADLSPSGRAPRVPARFLACLTPRLTTLYVYGCIVDLSSPFFSSLANLEDIEINSISDMSRPSSAGFSNLLTRSPSVRRLHLGEFLPQPFDFRFTLANLTELLISENSLETCLQFLQHVKIPRASDITLLLYGVPLQLDNYHQLVIDLISLLADFVKSRVQEESVLIASLSITSDSFSVGCDIVESESDLRYARFSDLHKLVRISCNIECSEDRPVWGIASACMSIWFNPRLCARVQKLRVGNGDEDVSLPLHSEHFWLPILETMSQVRYLTLEGARGAMFLHLLAMPRGARPLPALQELVLQKVNLSAGVPGVPRARAHLIRVLDGRRGVVTSLCLVLCTGVSTALVQTLASNGVDVDEVYW